MALWESRLMVLLSDETDLPSWYPVELFSVTDSHVPGDWLCEVNMQNDGGLRAIQGYERLIRDDAHHDALQERTHPRFPNRDVGTTHAIPASGHLGLARCSLRLWRRWRLAFVVRALSWDPPIGGNFDTRNPC
jgi:hypothetical protein